MSMFSDAIELPKIENNAERHNVLTMNLMSITHHDRFIHTLDITYGEMETVLGSDGKERVENKREKVIIPPSDAITYIVSPVDGYESVIYHFPQRMYSDEVWNSTPIVPYVRCGGHPDRDRIPCKIKIVIEDKIFDYCKIMIEKD